MVGKRYKVYELVKFEQGGNELYSDIYEKEEAEKNDDKKENKNEKDKNEEDKNKNKNDNNNNNLGDKTAFHSKGKEIAQKRMKIGC